MITYLPYNMDNCCVELKFTDGSMIAIDTIAVENEVADNMYQRSELLLCRSNRHSDSICGSFP